MARHYTIERMRETGLAVYWRCSAGAKGGEMVTVRRGRDGVYVCLTHRSLDCEHTRAVIDFAYDEERASEVAA